MKMNEVRQLVRELVLDAIDDGKLGDILIEILSSKDIADEVDRRCYSVMEDEIGGYIDGFIEDAVDDAVADYLHDLPARYIQQLKGEIRWQHS